MAKRIKQSFLVFSGKTKNVMLKGIISAILLMPSPVFSLENQPTKAATQRQMQEHSANYFRKNMGQWNDSTLYRGSASGAGVAFLKNKVCFTFSRAKEGSENGSNNKNVFEDEMEQDLREAKEYLVYHLKFKNQNPETSIVNKYSHDSKTNYIRGNDPAKYVTNAPEYEQIVYQNIYEKTDLIWYSIPSETGPLLKYDFSLKPGADAGDISLVYEGVKSIRINKNGELEVTTAWGTFIKDIPYSYQVKDGSKNEVNVSYIITGNNSFGFKITGEYDRKSPLVIDPVVMQWGTHVGEGLPNDGYLFDIAVDQNKNIYGTGWYDDSFPVTAGSYDDTFNGVLKDVYVFKLSAGGDALIYATYIGGSDADQCNGIAVNAAGEAYVTGYTKSNDFPTNGSSIDNTFGGYIDGVVCKLNAAGNDLIYSTYIGGALGDQTEGKKICVSSTGEAFVTGASDAPDFPFTIGGFNGSFDVFVVKINAAGTIFDYAFLLGGSSTEKSEEIEINTVGEAFVAGRTLSNDFPTTAGCADNSLDGLIDGFITKLDITGSILQYSTYLGGGDNDKCQALTIDAIGNAYVTGETASVDFPTTSGCYDNGFNGIIDFFVTKLNPSGTSLVYSTFIGGSKIDQPTGIAVNSLGEVFVAGETLSNNFPTTACASDSYVNTAIGDGDLLLLKLDAGGNNLLYSSFFGGDYWDYREGRVLILEEGCTEELVVCGTTHSEDFPTTPGSFRPAKLNGQLDQPVLFKLREEITPHFGFTIDSCTVSFLDSTRSSCTFDNNDISNYYWDFGDGTSSSLQDPVHVYSSTGSYDVWLKVSCPSDSIMKTVVVIDDCCEEPFQSSSDVTCNNQNDGSALLTGQGTGPWNYQWVNETGSTIQATNGLNGPDNMNNLTAGVYTVQVSNGSGCITQEVVTITEPSGLILTTDNIDATCNQSDGQASVSVGGGAPGYTYFWPFDGSTNDTLSNLGSGIYTVVVTDASGCMDSVDVSVSDFPAASLELSSDSAVCNGDANGNAVVTPTGTGPFTYSWSSGGTDSTETGLLAGTYTVTVIDGGGCVTIANVDVEEPTLLMVSMDADSSFCGQSNGQAWVSVSGGTLPYASPQWDDLAGQTTDTAFGLAAGTYTVTLTDANGCPQTGMVTIADIPGPNLSLTSAINITCKGANNGTAAVTSTGSSLTYLWTPGGYISQSETNLPPNAYNVVVTDGNGCKDSLTITITEPAVLTSTVSPTDATCGISDGQATATPNGGTGPYTYAWDIDPAQASNFVDTFSVGNHSVTITDDNGCDTTYSFTIINPNAPALALTQTAQIQCYGDNNAIAQANPAGGAGSYMYNWNTTPVQNTQTAIDLPTGTYTVTVTDDNNCQVQQTITITEPLQLTSQITSTNATCDNNNGSITASANGGTGVITYQWNPPAGNIPNPTNLSPGTYTVTMTDVNGCQTIETATILMASNNPVVSAWPDTTIIAGSSVSIATTAVGGGGNGNCVWTPPAGLSNDEDCNPTASPTQTTTYTVIYTDQNGCKNSDNITITVEEQTFTIYIPNAFTPNDDNLNATFDIRGEGITDYQLNIFDRWGEIVFESQEMSNSWGGRAHDKKEVQEDVYVYFISVKDKLGSNHDYVGRVTVIR